MNCAIVIISHKEILSDFELISLNQCCNVFKNRSIFLIVPDSLDLKNYNSVIDSLKVVRTKDKNLCTYEAFNRYKISIGLYWKFRKYDYILFYEPDAYVFKDDLDFWMDKNYSLIGAPWLENVNDKLIFNGVGNGGFSLRHVNSHIKALLTFMYIENPKSLVSSVMDFPNRNIIQKYLSILKRLTISNNTFFLFNDFNYHEDVFWSNHVSRIYDWFVIPLPEEALKFSFEVEPLKLFELNNFNLPMGCHAWAKYDLDFWLPKIINK